MSLWQIYLRVLSLLAAEKGLAITLTLGNLLLAGVFFLEPWLFGQVVDALANATHGNAWHYISLWAAVGLGGVAASVYVSLYAERLAHRKVVRVTWGAGDEATRVSLDQPVSQALTATLDEMLGKRVLRVPTLGGSLPTATIERTLGVPLVIFPIANHDDNQHAKDENLRLQNLWDGIEAYAAIMMRMEALWPKMVP